jgi:hypothetical protein
MVHARFLSPLVKARGFGMTTFKTIIKLIHNLKFYPKYFKNFPG